MYGETHTYVEMNCIGDYADFVVYDYHVNLNDKWIASASNWMVPGSWNDRDEFGRKLNN